MKIFDAATEHIKQGGKRRGANMGVLRVDHPDIMEFVIAKLDGQTLRNFNLSVGVTDAFMEAVRRDRHYDLIHPRTGRPVGQLRAKDVFDAVVKAAWQTGDPGLLFLDTVNRTNPVAHLGLIEATNPCGEIPLLPYESCNLGSINLAHVVMMQDGRAVIDWEKLRATVRVAVRFLDDVIEVNRYPIAEIERMTRGTNKIGLGVMGFAEMLIRLGVSYDSTEAVRLAERVMRAVADEALAISQALADERGVFPRWKGSTHEAHGVRVRHATRTAIAPTGTLSLIAGTSASIEPLFALAYRRTHVLEGQILYEVAPLLCEYLDRHGADAERLIDQVMDTGRLRDIPDMPEEVKRVFVTALEIPAEQHLQVQAAFQRHVDNAVSKTINLPHDARPEDVYQAYWQAWELGLKGITIYRYGSKSTQVLELGVHEEAHHYDHASPCDPEECRI
jgi:ribonucleoside-diphosphate reductase alpha chain